ncbi:MAG: VanZ family protein [Gemmatimonadaceae bacterium]
MIIRTSSRDFSLAAGALWLSLTLYETLRPVGWVQVISFWSFWVQSMAGVDMVQNIVLFAPMGWIAHRARWSTWRTVLAALLLSSGIEFAQQWVPGRASMATDILFNTAGAALGWWMATPVRRPRLRTAISFMALAGFLGLHALNTAWPAGVTGVDGAGGWKGVTTKPCDAGALESTICLVIPNELKHGNKLILATGPTGETYARVQGNPLWRSIAHSDCVTTRFESTLGARLRFRPPIARNCALVHSRDSSFELQVDPRLVYTRRGTWEPRRAAAWMWPVWPFETYRRDLLRAAGALTFVSGTALLAASAPWWIPAGYLLMVTLAAAMTGMRPPAWWELAWTAAAWLLAVALVRLDAWWRRPA